MILDLSTAIFPMGLGRPSKMIARAVRHYQAAHNDHDDDVDSAISDVSQPRR